MEFAKSHLQKFWSEIESEGASILPDKTGFNLSRSDGDADTWGMRVSATSPDKIIIEHEGTLNKGSAQYKQPNTTAVIKKVIQRIG